MSKVNLKALSKSGMKEFVKTQGLPEYRTKQIFHWIYEKKAGSIEEITELSNNIRKQLSEVAYISNLELLKRQASKDGTEKFLFKLEDGETIEAVLIPNDDGRLTLCISSQVGCAMGCRFCITGRIGFKRNLEAHEIVDQIISVMKAKKFLSQADLPKANKLKAKSSESKYITNIVLMGMGEPLANFDEVTEALHRMIDLMGISGKRITVSTAGIVPKILEFHKNVPKVRLAVSLNASDDATRNKIMPVNRIYPIRSLIDACKRIKLSPRENITFEYVMFEGLNDRPDDAKKLLRIIKGIPSKVNLIPFNAYSGSEFKKPSDENVLAFQKILVKGRIYTFIRKSKGQDILAACGQLRAGYKLKS
jgi:23S rRNA (adenine2503-C2)-methyltransferase